MPALSFQNLPAAQTQEIRDTLHTQWQIEARALNVKPFKSQQQANAESAKLDAKYQQMELKAFTQLQQQTEEQQRVQDLIKQPQERTRAEEAQLRMELEPEAERLVFPAEPQPFSIGQITSTAVMQSIQDFAEAAPTTHEFFTRRENEPKTKQGIINQYLEWRSLIRYNDLDLIYQQPLDQQWDAFMAGDEKYNEWWSNKEKHQPIVEIKALRTPGDIGKIMKGRIVGAAGITPIGESVTKAKPRSAVPMDPTLFGVHAARALMRRKPARTVAPEQKPIRQRNKRTRQERISYDGGKTWQTIG